MNVFVTADALSSKETQELPVSLAREALEGRAAASATARGRTRGAPGKPAPEPPRGDRPPHPPPDPPLRVRCSSRCQEKRFPALVHYLVIMLAEKKYLCKLYQCLRKGV